MDERYLREIEKSLENKELAAARAEIERLTQLLDLSKKTTEAVLERAEKAEAERDSFQAMFRSCLKGNDALREKAQKANTERDEARAQVAAAYEAAAKTCSLAATNYLGKGADTDLGSRSRAICDVAFRIRALAPAHAKAALEAYGREKMREGMKRAEIACLGLMTAHSARQAILAAMEKLK